MVRAVTIAAAALFAILQPLVAHAAKPKPLKSPDERPAAISAAKTIFLTNGGPDFAAVVFACFEQALSSAHRFQTMPTPLGADLLVEFLTDSPSSQIPTLVLQLRDPHDYHLLGKLEGPWAIFPTDRKNAEEVTHLLNTFFALDLSGPPPAFQAPLLHEPGFVGRMKHDAVTFPDLGYSPKVAGIGGALHASRSVLIVNDDADPRAASLFAAYLNRGQRFVTVSDLAQADLIGHIHRDFYCRDTAQEASDRGLRGCGNVQPIVRLDVLSSATLGKVFSNFVNLDSNPERLMKRLEENFEQRLTLLHGNP